jgi:hypothetical protein
MELTPRERVGTVSNMEAVGLVRPRIIYSKTAFAELVAGAGAARWNDENLDS